MSLNIIEYSSGTTIDYQITEYFKRHQDLRFDTFYPGGLYGTCSFFVPGEIIYPLILVAGKRIEIYDGLQVLWEGVIENTILTSSTRAQGVTYECTGQWGYLLQRRKYDKVFDAGETSTSIILNVQSQFTEFNSDTHYISSNTRTLGTVISDYGGNLASLFTDLSSLGDSSFNPWAAGVLASGVAASPNGKPVIYFEQQPAITSSDYRARLGEIENNIEISRNTDETYNYIIVGVIDAGGDYVYYTSDDYAGLKDTSSISAYGQRDYLLSLGEMGTADAMNYGYRFLAARKNPQWYINGSLEFNHTIRSVTSGPVPVAWVQAGERIMIENYLNEIFGGGIIFMITQTTYYEDRDTLTIRTGNPDPLAVLGAQLERQRT
jgi:hypothetical protein